MFKILGSDGKEYGPVTRGNVIEWIRDGRANLQTKVCRSDETEWKTLADFPEFVPTGSTPAIPPPSPSAEAEYDIPVPEITAAQPLAGLRRRFAAALIDGFLQWLCWLPASMAMMDIFSARLSNNETPSLEMIQSAITQSLPKSLPYLIGLAIIQTALLCRRSQSVGKIILKIRIVTVRDGAPGGPLRAYLLRGLLTWAIEFTPYLGILFRLFDSFCIFREDQRCIHDLIAGTKVVKIEQDAEK